MANRNKRPSSSWKAAERTIAAELGTTRIPNTGKGTPDIVDDHFAYENKKRKLVPTWLIDMVEQAERNSVESGKIPAVILSEVSQGRRAKRMVIIPWSYWLVIREKMNGTT